MDIYDQIARGLRFCDRTLRAIGRGRVYRFLEKSTWFRNLPGKLLALRSRVSKRPFVITDGLRMRYWQHPGDDVFGNWKRGAICDSTGVVRHLLQNVRTGQTCVDVGANAGGVSVPLWSKVGSTGRVISVEADPVNADKLKRNLTLNGFQDRYVMSVALSDKMGTLQLRCYPESNGWQTLGNPSFAKSYDSFLIDVPAMDFETLAGKWGIRWVDWMKIDVEGAELKVLSGMRRFLEEKRIARVIFEVNYLMLEGFGLTVEQLLEFWKGLDYDLFVVNEDGSAVPLEETWPSQRVGDCLALARNCKGQQKDLRLDLGCAASKRPGFIGIDSAPCADVTWDLHLGIPFEDNSTLEIRSDHLFEHLELKYVVNLLRECRRVLVPGGVLDFSVPHVNPYLDAYLRKDFEFLKDKISDVPQGEEHLYGTCFDRISWLLYRSGEHLSAFDADSILDKVRLAGFTQASMRNYDPESDPNPRYSSIYVRAVK